MIHGQTALDQVLAASEALFGKGDLRSVEPGLLAAAREADLLLVECSTPDELYTPGHLTPSRVGELCAEARPRRVVLTHLYAPAAALDLPALVRRRFDGPVETAEDGTCYRVGGAPPAGRPEPPAARGV